MFTICPKCTLTLVVTTVDLRAGQGYVRCGRCANVFNALVALREGDPAGSTSDSARRRLIETAPPPAEPALGSGVAFDPEPEPAPESEPEPGAIEAAAEELSLEPAVEESAEGSLEFDATATDVSEIFISPIDGDHDTGSGSYEAVVLSDEPQSAEAPETEPEPEPALEQPEPAFTDTVTAGEWSLLDDDDPPADAESVIEESPLAQSAEAEPETEPEMEFDPDADTSAQPTAQDPPWVEQMFEEAEVEAVRARTAEHRLLDEATAEADGDESPVVQAARDVRGVSASSGDTALEPLLKPAAPRRPAWQYVTGCAVLALLLLLQILHLNRHSLVLNPTFGPLVSTVYRWFHVTLIPRWDLTAYAVKQLGAEAEGSEGTRLRVRLSVQNDSDRVQPLPLLRLTLQDRYGNAVATRDLEPEEYLPARATDRRLLEPNSRIDAELHVIDPGKAAIGFEIDACLRSESGAIGCANDVRRRATG